MSRPESSPSPFPSYRSEPVLGRLHQRIVEPVAASLSPVLRTLDPALTPLGKAGHELYTALGTEGAVNRKAAAIESLQDRFERDAAGGTALLERSLAVVQEMNGASPDKSQKAERSARLAGVASDLQQWFHDTGGSRARIGRDPEAFRTMTQELMAGYLFHRNAALFRSEGKNLDREKARRQMKGVAAMLLGNHAHMGTGEGKSTVVLPIVALIESRTSAENDVILATASDQSVAELQAHVARLEKELPEASRCNLETYSYDLKLEAEGNKTELAQLQRRMQKEAVLQGGYADGLQKNIRDLYWKEQMRGVLTPPRSDMVENKSGGPRVLFATERDIIFAFEDDPERMVAEAPTILMDEADIPYRRRTPYVTTNEAQYYSPKEVEDSMGEWLLHYIVNDRLRYPTATDEGDFIPTQNGFALTPEAQHRLDGLNLRNFIEHPRVHSAAKRAFKQGIKLISAQIGLDDPRQREALETRMQHWFKANLPSAELPPQEDGVQEAEEERVTDMQAMVTTIAERLGGQYYKRGVGYLMEEGGSEVQIRDAYIDDLLEGHRNQSQIQTAILAMNGKYSFVPPYRTAGRSVYFQTFVSTMRDRIRCASGSLLYPDLLDQKMKKDAFASFLEVATGSSVVLISPPDIKKAPQPSLHKTHGEAMDRLVADVSAREQPRLVICYDRLEGQALADRFTAANPGKKVVYVPIHPTPDQVAGYCRDLAEGKVDILVSAGNLGFGVNIVKNNGEFPDLHVSLYGLPENQLQVVQAFGRRRKEGADFSWYISEPDVYQYIADFKAETTWRERVIQGYYSVEQMLQGYDEAKKDPRKGLVFIADLLHQHEVGSRTDDAYVTYFDQSMDTVRKYAFERLRDLVLQDIGQVRIPAASAKQLETLLHELEARAVSITRGKLTRSIETGKRDKWIAKNIPVMVSQYGLPDEMDEDMQHELAVAGPSLQAQNLKDLVTNRFQMHVFGGGLSGRKSIIDTYVDDWYAERKKSMEAVVKLLSDNFRLERMFPAVLRPAREEFAQAAGLDPDPSMDSRILGAFQPFPPGSAQGVPEGVVLGIFAVEDMRVLGCIKDGKPMLLSSFNPEKDDFDWETRRISDRVGMMPLGSPIGKAKKENEEAYFVWTSHR